MGLPGGIKSLDDSPRAAV